MGASAVSITQGTQSSIAVDNIGGASGTNYQIIKLDYGAAGVSTPFVGTLTSKIDLTPVNTGTPLATVGTTGAAVWGTLVAAAGAGTKQYVSGVDISVVSGT